MNLVDLVSLLLALVLAAGTGGALVTALTDGWRGIDRAGRLHLACVSVILGLGVQSVARFLLMACDLPVHRGLFWLDLTLLMMALIVARLATLRHSIASAASSGDAVGLTASPSASRWLRWPLTWALFTSTVWVVCQCMRRLHGDHDAWSIWNVRARVMFREPDHWRNAFIASVHADYPLHLPLTTARFWHYLGHDTPWVPVLIAIGAWALCVIMLMSALRSLRGSTSAWLALAAFVAWPLVGPLWSLQYADPIIAVHLLGAITLIAQASARGHHWGMLALAGFCAGCAAWTKNEGLPIALVLLASVAVLPRRGLPLRQRATATAAFLLGAMPGLVTLATMKFTIALHNDVMGQQNAAGVLAKLADVHRYEAIVKSFWWHVFNVPEWAQPAEKVGIWSLPLLSAVALTLGPARQPRLAGAVIRVIAALLAIFGVYLLVYLLTPHNIYWHIATSVTRLMLQLWPSLVFAVFLTCRTPGEMSELTSGDRVTS